MTDQVSISNGLRSKKFQLRATSAVRMLQSLQGVDQHHRDQNQQLELAEKDKIDFKIKARHFVKIYGQMASTIHAFEVLEWESSSGS